MDEKESLAVENQQLKAEVSIVTTSSIWNLLSNLSQLDEVQKRLENRDYEVHSLEERLKELQGQ